MTRAKLDTSQAEFWIFVLRGFESDASDFVVVPTAELQRRMTELHGSHSGKLQSYFCSTKNNECWEIRSRGLGDDIRKMKEAVRNNPLRDFTQYLNADGWATLMKKLKA